MITPTGTARAPRHANSNRYTAQMRKGTSHLADIILRKNYVEHSSIVSASPGSSIGGLLPFQAGNPS